MKVLDSLEIFSRTMNLTPLFVNVPEKVFVLACSSTIVPVPWFYQQDAVVASLCRSFLLLGGPHSIRHSLLRVFLQGAEKCANVRLQHGIDVLLITRRIRCLIVRNVIVPCLLDGIQILFLPPLAQGHYLMCMGVCA